MIIKIITIIEFIKKLKLRLRTYIALGLLAIIVPFILITLFRPSGSEAAWWNADWLYRKAINIASHTASENNVYVTVPTFDATDTTRYQADCGDLRFTKENGELLKYYVVDCDATANIHVQFDTLPAGESNYYMYYANPSADNGFEAVDFSTAASGLGSLTAGSEATTPGPIAEWKFDEAQGQTVQDSSSNNNDGTLGANSSPSTDDPTWVPEGECVRGNCLRFDGTDDYVSDTAITPTLSGNLTISFWMKTNVIPTVSNRRVIDIGQSSDVGLQLAVNTTGYLYLDNAGGPGSVLTSPSVITDNKWHHVALSRSSTTYSFYIDNILIGTRTGTAPTYTKLFIGNLSTGGSYFYNGMIDELKIYPYARSAAQVKVDFNNGSANMGTPSRASLTKGLIGYWKFEETSWTVDCSTGSILDSAGTGVHAASCPTSTGPTAGTAGKFGNAANLDGVNDYLQVRYPTVAAAPLDIVNSSVSISSWVNPTNISSTKAIVGKLNGSIFGYGLSLTTTGVTLNLRSPGDQVIFSCAATVPITVNVWTHLAGTVFDTGSGTVSYIYVNGALVRTCTSTSRVGSASGAFYIGSRSGGELFPGKIDDLRIYNRTLSGAEVNLLATEGNGPVGYWKLDENTGTTANDSSALDNSATLTNTPTWTSGKYGSGVNFAGSDQHITRADDADFDFADDASMTVEAFFKHSAASAQEVILSKYNEAGYKIIMESDGDITCALDYDSTWTPTDSITSTAATYDDNFWHHVACVKGGASTLKLYIDGILIGTDAALTADNTLTNSDPLYIGIDADGSSNDFVGQIDEVKIYTYARSGGQVIEDLNGGHPNGGSPVGSYVSMWTMDENGGTTANDFSANANSLTLSTSSWTKSGKINSAWNGVGTNWLSRADDDDLDFVAADDFSLSLWFKSDSADNPAATEYLLDKSLSDATQSGGYAIYAKTTGVICLGIEDDSTWAPDDEACSTADVYDGNWHHVTAQKNNNTSISITVDGILVGTDASLLTTGSLANARIFYLGDRDGVDNGDEFNGDLDDVKIFRAFLNEEQIRIVMNAGATANYGSTAATEATQVIDGAGNSPVGEWKMDENTGTAAYDTSGNGRTGTLTTGPLWTPGKYGPAVQFDGSDDFIDVGAGPGTVNTVSFWVFPTTTTEYPIDLNGTEYVWINAGTVTAQGFTTPTIYINGVAATTISAGVWSHVAVTTATALNASDFDIGRIEGVGNHEGKIDQVRLWDYALTASQVAYDYNRGAPIAHWRFDECQGTTAYDASGNGLNGTIVIGASGEDTVGTCATSSTAWGSGAIGKFNSSLSFDGTDDYVEIPDHSSLDGFTSFSLSTWVKPSSVADLRMIITKDDSGTADTPFNFNIQNYYMLRFAMRTSAGWHDQSISVGDIATDTWHHMVAVYDGSNVNIYVNGIYKGGYSATGTVNTTSDKVRIGARGGGTPFYFAGQIDDVRIYNYPLSATQVKKVFNEGAGVRFGPLTGSP